MDWTTQDHASILRRGKRFSLHQSVQSSSEACPPSYCPAFSEGKSNGTRSWLLTSTWYDIRNEWRYNSTLPLSIYGVQRDKFTLSRRHLFRLFGITVMAFHWPLAHRFGNTALDPCFPVETEIARKGWLSTRVEFCGIMNTAVFVWVPTDCNTFNPVTFTLEIYVAKHSFCAAWPWSSRHHEPSKCRLLFTSRHGVTSQLTRIISNTTSRTSYLPCSQILVGSDTRNVLANRWSLLR